MPNICANGHRLIPPNVLVGLVAVRLLAGSLGALHGYLPRVRSGLVQAAHRNDSRGKTKLDEYADAGTVGLARVLLGAADRNASLVSANRVSLYLSEADHAQKRL